MQWLWDGFVARGCITLLTSQWKAGKTTLMSLLLTRRMAGGTVAGRAVQPGKTVVLTEEGEGLCAMRTHKYDFGPNVCFFPQPFCALPKPEQWHALLDEIRTLSRQHNLDWLVIDPLAPLVRCENSAQAVLDILLPLRDLTHPADGSEGMGVTVLHHPGKGHRTIGQAARGSGAMLGHADIIVEMRHPGGNPHTRRRRLHCLSRHEQTPGRLLLELNAEGTDYDLVAEEETDDFAEPWNVLHMILEDAPQKLTRRDILLEWPDDFDQPSSCTLFRWLRRAQDQKLLLCEGTGRKKDPFRYWLAEKETEWLEDPLYQAIEKQRLELKLPFQPLHPTDPDKFRVPDLDLD